MQRTQMTGEGEAAGRDSEEEFGGDVEAAAEAESLLLALACRET